MPTIEHEGTPLSGESKIEYPTKVEFGERIKILRAIQKCERRIGRGKEIETNKKKIDRLVKILEDKNLLHSTDDLSRYKNADYEVKVGNVSYPAFPINQDLNLARDMQINPHVFPEKMTPHDVTNIELYPIADEADPKFQGQVIEDYGVDELNGHGTFVIKKMYHDAGVTGYEDVDPLDFSNDPKKLED
jgi:hypothetical protein